jgi:hypothetical protein
VTKSEGSPWHHRSPLIYTFNPLGSVLTPLM